MLPVTRPVLVVTGLESIRSTLVHALGSDGYDVRFCETIAAGREEFDRAGGRFAAVILETDLPDGDGRLLCAEIRTGRPGLPVVLLSHSDQEADLVAGFAIGATDYVTMPFRSAELLARVRAAVRTSLPCDDTTFDIGGDLLNPARRLLMKPDGRTSRLTDKECRLLLRLYGARGQSVSRDVLLAEIWGTEAGTHTLDSHIYRLRQKIESDRNRPETIVTTAGGYRLSVKQAPDGRRRTPFSLAFPSAAGGD